MSLSSDVYAVADLHCFGDIKVLTYSIILISIEIMPAILFYTI